MPNKIFQKEIEFLSKKILKLNDDIIDSQKEKTIFISLVANQLNNPMTAILGLLPHLKIQENEKNRQLFELIYENILNLDFKIQNLLTVTKIESGEVEHLCTLVNIQEILDEVLESLKYTLKSKNINIIIENKVDKKIDINSKNIYIILRNLISNGCLHGIANSNIKVVIELKDSILNISVTNKGKIKKFTHKEDIFTRFGNTIDQEHGLGIGLSVVKALLSNQEGTIDYFYKNNLTTFIATIPIKPSELIFDSEDSFIEF
ncbi:MAG: two-component system, OmpR family, sensor kinase [Campylobacterota bacterium]|nr:two-component system, OmpR family, sensor kinase [Campylobacterota bacterium]